MARAKRFRGSARIRGGKVALLLAALACAVSAQPPPEAGTTAPVQAPRRLIDLAARIQSRSHALAAIWPGYWPEDQAFILYDPEAGALLVSPGAHPASYAPLREADVPASLRGRLFFHRGRLPGMRRPFDIDLPIGDGRTAVIVDVSSEDILTLLFHEQFHSFQLAAFGPAAPQFVDPLAIRDRVAFAADAQVERRVLDAALAATTEASRSRRLRQYFALRRAREASVPEAVVRVERGFERSEGVAKYVDRRAHAIFSERPTALPALLRAELSPLVPSDSTPFLTTWFRSRAYGNGAALSYLLSLYDPAGWQRAVESGGQLDLLLERRIGPIRNPGRLAAAARAEFGHAAIAAALGPVIRAAERTEIKSVAEFLALAPVQLVVEMERTGTGFSGRALVPLSPAIVALPRADRLASNGPGVELAVEGRPVLLDSRGAGSTITVLLPAPPLLDGRTAPAGERRIEGGTIRGEGLDLRLDRPAIMTVEGNRIRIRVLPLPSGGPRTR
ncbi:MAG TPA: hypothetical protein VEC11_16360 [Allosphingosinicella sp.]|nr:hypothetical protein [Allosphingosinicella sp.]